LDERKRKLRHLQKNGVDLLNFDPETVYTYFANRIKEGSPAHSLNHYIKALNAWMKFRSLDHHFDLYKSYYHPIRVPTKEEISCLLKACSRSRKHKQLKVIIFLLANTGLRASELCNLRIKNIDTVNNKIEVLGKGGKWRTIPVKQNVITGDNFPSIINYMKYHRLDTSKDFLFTGPHGKLLTAVMRREFKAVAKDAGIPWIHPHSMRHYYATTLLKNGVNVKTVQILLGHSTLVTTSRYLHITEMDVDKAIRDVPLDDLLFSKQIMVDFWNRPTRLYGGYGNGPGEIYSNPLLMSCRPDRDKCVRSTPGGDVFVRRT
jgi:integrase/recombinase XerD